MTTSCSDVCEIMHDRLLNLGFEITSNENHDDMIDSLFETSLVHDSDYHKLNTIKKIYEGYYNTGQNTEEFAAEFFYTIGEILQGKELKDLDLKYLNMEDMLRKEQ